MSTRWGMDYAERVEAWSASPFWSRDAAEVERYLPPFGWDGVLVDIGCGTGRLLERVRLRVAAGTLVGVDPNAAGLRIAEKRLGRGVVLLQDVSDAGRGLADVAVVMHALPQFERQDDELRRIREVMKPGAQIVVVVHNKTYEALRWPLRRLRGHRDDDTIVTHYSLGSLRRTMVRAGFEERRAYRFGGSFIAGSASRPRIIYVGRRPSP